MELSPSWEVINANKERKMARLILEDDSVFEGYSFGACRSSPGEVGKCAGHVKCWLSMVMA